jgi:CDGSH-type Zn-finger protein
MIRGLAVFLICLAAVEGKTLQGQFAIGISGLQTPGRIAAAVTATAESSLRKRINSMTDVTIRIRDNGPLLVEGPFSLVDAEGKPLELPAGKPAYALCRCGASKNKPFCDGTHKECGFESVIRSE